MCCHRRGLVLRPRRPDLGRPRRTGDRPRRRVERGVGFGGVGAVTGAPLGVWQRVRGARSLRAVTGSVNTGKGAADPSNWIQPNADFVCTYLSDWVSIVARWGLSMSAGTNQPARRSASSPASVAAANDAVGPVQACPCPGTSSCSTATPPASAASTTAVESAGGARSSSPPDITNSDGPRPAAKPSVTSGSRATWQILAGLGLVLLLLVVVAGAWVQLRSDEASPSRPPVEGFGTGGCCGTWWQLARDRAAARGRPTSGVLIQRHFHDSLSACSSGLISFARHQIRCPTPRVTAQSLPDGRAGNDARGSC
jgi:hypothetical protein